MGLDIGTLTGRLELQDGMSSALMLMKGKVGSVETAFNNLDTSAKSVGLAIAATGVAIVGAVVGIGAAIVKLGTDGSRIEGIEDAFNNLAKAAGTTSEALIGPLSAALRNTVHEGDLMAMLNKSLGAGVRLTAADMTVLGETARAMGKAFGTDASQGLETLNSALTSGNTRALKRMGIIVDMVAAEKTFAASIGTTADQLNEAGKLEAKRLGMLDAMRDRVNKMGVSEMSLAEKISAGKVAVEEWFEKLSLAVEKSSAVHGAFDKIRASIEKAFGASSQTLLDKVVEWINRFAYAVGEYGPKIIQAIVDIKDWIVKVWVAVQAAWDMVPEWFKRIAFDAGLAAIAIGGTNIAVKGITGTDTISLLANFAQIWSVIGTNVGKAATAMKEWMLLVAAFKWEAVGLGISTVFAPIIAFATGSVAGAIIVAASAVGVLSVALKELAGITYTAQLMALVALFSGGNVWESGKRGQALANGPQVSGATGQMPGYMTSSWSQPAVTKTPSMMARPQSVGSVLSNEFTLADVVKPFDDNSKFIKSGLADLQSAMDAMSGQQLIDDLKEQIATYDALIKNGITPTIEAQKALHEQAGKVIAIMLETGQKVPPAFIKIKDATAEAAKGIDRWSKETTIATDEVWKWGRALDNELRPALTATANLMNVTLLPAVVKTGGIFDETGKRIGELADTAKTALPSVGEMLDALGTAFENINSKVGQSIQVMSGFWKVMKDGAVSGVTKVVTGLSAVSEVINTVVTGTGRMATATRGFFAGAAMGAALGLTVASMLSMNVATGAVTMGIGAAVGALAMMVIAWNAAGKAARAANKEADAALADMRARLLDTYGSIQQVDTMGQMLGVDLAGAWGDTTTAGLKHFSQLLDEFNAKLKSLSDAAQTFGFTWADMSGEMAAFFGGKIADNLVEQFNLLVNSGIDVDAVTRSMSGAINDYIRDAEQAGVAVPAALQIIIDKMKEMGLLGTTSNIAAEAGYKTIEDLQKIADKAKAIYDYMVESGKYSTAELAKAWEAYTKAAEDTLGGVATSFSAQMAALNTEMKTLTEAVAAEAEEDVMGVIETQQRERMAQIEQEQAALTTQEAAARAAATSVTEAARTDFDTLFGDVVSKSADAAAKVSQHWRRAPWEDWGPLPTDGGPGGGGAWDDGWNPGGGVPTREYASGGVVYAASGWAPQGSDTVPAMLTPGERVLTVAQNQAYESRQEYRIPIALDSTPIVEVIIKRTGNRIAVQGIRR